MYKDEIFENALKEVKEENFKALKLEINSMEEFIDRLLQKIFECSAFKSERDFHVGLV